MGATRIVMCGCTSYGEHLASRLLANGIQFSYFVLITPENAVKYQISGYCDLRPLAAAHGIPVYMAQSYALTADDDRRFFREQSFDLLVQGGWQRLFPNEVIEGLGIGAVGVHGSADLLPKGRGRSPLNWSLIEGKKRFLLQLFLMRAGADDGPVFDCEAFDITERDSIETLYFKNVIVTTRMLLRSIDKLAAGTPNLHPQKGAPSYYPKRSPEDGAIDWEEMDVHYIDRLVRASTRPYPGAYGVLGGVLQRIWRAQVFDTRLLYPDAAYGDVVERFGDVLIVNCRGGLLLVDNYEPIA